MHLKTHTSMWWPTINKKIADHVQLHVPCQIISNSQSKQPVIPMEVPSRPWKTLGIDLFLHNTKWYPLVPNYYSKVPWVEKMSIKYVISAASVCFFSTWHSRGSHLLQ